MADNDQDRVFDAEPIPLGAGEVFITASVGIALSGGGSRGYAHVGVLERLESNDFPIDVVAGTSMGAVIGVHYADGIHPSKIREMAENSGWTQGTNISAVRLLNLMISDQLLSTKRIEDYISEHIGEKLFRELKKPFGCVATDIKTGEKIIFREGKVAPAVRASMNLPGLFAPVEYRHRYLVDGGIVDFVPVDVAKLLGADWVIASVTESDYTRSTFPNVLFALEQVIDISGLILARQSAQKADFIISPDAGDIKIYELWRSGETADRGVLAANAKIDQAKDALILHSTPHLLRRWSRP